MKGTLEKAYGHQGDAMNLPVPDLAAALPFYENKLGFRVVSRGDTPYHSAVLARDNVQIGLAENGGDPTQDGCAFHVTNIEALAAEFDPGGRRDQPPEFEIEHRDGVAWKVFFVVAPDGLCYWFGERQAGESAAEFRGRQREVSMSTDPAFPYATYLDVKFPPLSTVDVPALVRACTDRWYNQTLCKVNDAVVRLGVMQGEYHWHKHDNDDEFFFVLEGHFVIDLEDRSVDLQRYEGFVVPKGVLHRTRAPERAVILMMETAAIVPTGDA